MILKMSMDSENIDFVSDFSIQPVPNDDLPFPLSQPLEVRDQSLSNFYAKQEHHYTGKVLWTKMLVAVPILALPFQWYNKYYLSL
jgi:hypothetical protein